MISFLKKYYAFVAGFVLLVPITWFLKHIGFLLLPETIGWEGVLLFVFWGIVISLPIYKFNYLQRKRKTVFKILGLLAFLIITIIIDSNWRLPDNPLTIFLIFCFWLGVFYLLIPKFIIKYKKYILIVYGFSMIYFTYVRLFSGSLEQYLEHEKGMAMALIGLPVPLFFTFWVYEQWKWLRTLRTDKTNAELALLKTQVNPHFFFNTLNNLYSLTVQHSDQAPKVILKLSDMMRYTIYEGKKDTVALKDEVEYLQNYIELHKIRYKKQVDIQFDCDIEDETQLSPLLFIILLENAFKHGIDSLADHAYVHMKLNNRGGNVHFEIENNFDPKEIQAEKGIGLDNLKHRLKLIYPQSHNLEITEGADTYKVVLNLKLT